MSKKKKDPRVELFLDSGAFSAFTQGVEIDIQEYIEFVQEHEGELTIYANLDVIGDAAATLKNQRIMEKAGLTPLPCFHPKEEFSYLARYIEEHDYIALGGLASKLYNRQDMTRYLDKCFEMICDTPDRMPKVKVHGFGLTSLPLMMRYPFYSVDSTSWVMAARMGCVYFPRYRKGRWIYDQNSWKIYVSARSPSKKDAGSHIHTLAPKQREVIERYIEEKGYKLGKSTFRVVKKAKKYELAEDETWCGKERDDGSREVETIVEAGLCNQYRHRDELNVIFFLDLEQNMQQWPWAWSGPEHRGQGGFGLVG